MKRTAIETDPAKVAAWQERSRQKARERAQERPVAVRRAQRGPSALDRPATPSAPLKPKPRKRKANIGHRRPAVMARSGGLCICGCGEPATQMHHVLPEQTFPELATREDNLVGVAELCHTRHERALRRLPRESLPACTIDLASTEDRYGAYLDRIYPVSA